MKTWLASCLASHSSCFDPQNGREPLPIRLLEIDFDCASTTSSIRLRCDASASSYLTLSHCWGRCEEPVLRLLQDNLEAFMEKIYFEDLPKTFKDAVTCAEQLGVRYLWIDSLCIIQDSKEDWLNQSSLMAEVFSRSLLNIAATSSANTMGGLFRLRDPAAVSCYFEPQDVESAEPGYFCVDLDSWERTVEKGILNTRAWVYQETVLASRTLHFTSEQIFWKCTQLCASEVFTGGMPMEFRQQEEHLSAHNLDMDPHLNCWSLIVEKYTTRELTYESKDKLVALSGVARKVAKLNEIPEDEYLAGIWKGMLPWGLLWRTSGYARSLDNSIPSWSWASVSGPVGFSNQYPIPDVQIIQSASIPGTDPFTKADDAIIFLEGRIIRCTLSRNTRSVSRIDWTISQLGEEHQIYASIDDSSWVNNHTTPSDVYLLPMYGSCEEPGGRESIRAIATRLPGPSTFNALGLILVRLHEKKGTFRRLGLFSAGESIEQASRLLELSKTKIGDADEYLAIDEEGRHSIAII
jgi:Heterokaryon incompatibility protein (HET)